MNQTDINNLIKGNQTNLKKTIKNKLQIFCENSQEVYDFNIILSKISNVQNNIEMIKGPFFNLKIDNNNNNPIKYLNKNTLKNFINGKNRDNIKSINFKPSTIHFDNYSQIINAEIIKKEFIKASENFEYLSNRKYFFFEQYFSNDANFIIVCYGGICKLTKLVVDELRKQKLKVGLIKIILYQPFPYDELSYALKNTKKIGIIDFNQTKNGFGPLFKNVICSCAELNDIKFQNYLYNINSLNDSKNNLNNNNNNENNINDYKNNHLNNQNILKQKIIKIYDDLINNRIIKNETRGM